MKIRNLTIHHLRIPLRVQFAQSNSQAKCSDSIVVELETEAGTQGYGECCPRRYVTDEDAASVQQDLNAVAATLNEYSFDTLDDIRRYVGVELPSRIGLSAACALEIALLDAWSRETQTNLIAALGGKARSSYTYTGVIPMGDFDKLRPLLSRFRFREVKIKVGADRTGIAARVGKLRGLYGPKTQVRVDANCAWSYADAMELTEAMIDLGVTCIEQPFPYGMDCEMGRLTARFGDRIAIMADESLTSYDSARFLAENGLCNRFNLKISKHGGILNTLRIYDLARKHDIPCQLGAHFGETSILTAAGLIVASAIPDLAAMEGGLGALLLEEDVCPEPLTMDRDGTIRGSQLESKPGLGLAQVSLPVFS